MRLMEMEEAYSIRIKEEQVCAVLLCAAPCCLQAWCAVVESVQSAITTMYEAKIKAMQRHHALELAAVRCCAPSAPFTIDHRGIEYDVDKENTELSAPSQSVCLLSECAEGAIAPEVVPSRVTQGT